MKAEIHWNKFLRKWTIHTYKGCTWADHLVVRGPWRTEVKPTRKTNPKGWVVADHSQIEILSLALPSGKKLMYDKDKMEFSVTKGNGIWFCPQGAFHQEGSEDCEKSG